MDVLVRQPREADLEALFRIHADPRTNVHWPEGAFKEMEQARKILETMLDERHSYGIGYWAVTPADSDEVIGFSGLRVKPAGRALAIARERWPERPVVARMRGANLPSQRVALSVGLTRAGHDSQGRIFFSDRRLYPSFMELLR